MSRLTQSSNYQQDNLDIQENNEEIIYDKIVLNKPKEYDNTERILALDLDSLLYSASYFPEDSLIKFSTDELQLEEGKFRIRNKIQEITNNVEECYNIKQTIIFLGGSKNFRYKLFPAYKANRKDKKISPLILLLKKYIVNELKNVVLSDGAEADDFCYEIYKITQGNCIIGCIDKDIIINTPGAIIYDYKTYQNKELENTTICGTFKSITEKESRLARVKHIIEGDFGDGICGAKGCGKAYCDKNLNIDMTNYQFIKQIFLAYLKSTKGDGIEAKKQIRLFYKLLKLWTKDELKTLNL